jgi:hypothetical protein
MGSCRHVSAVKGLLPHAAKPPVPQQTRHTRSSLGTTGRCRRPSSTCKCAQPKRRCLLGAHRTMWGGAVCLVVQSTLASTAYTQFACAHFSTPKDGAERGSHCITPAHLACRHFWGGGNGAVNAPCATLTGAQQWPLHQPTTAGGAPEYSQSVSLLAFCPAGCKALLLQPAGQKKHCCCGMNTSAPLLGPPSPITKHGWSVKLLLQFAA